MNLKEQNILFFTRTMKLGGTENVVLLLCEIFKPLVNSIVVCSCGGVNVDKLSEMEIKHYEIPDIESKSLSTLFNVSKTINDVVENERITIIHTHHRMAAFYVSLLGLYKKCTFLNTSHNTFENRRFLTRFAYSHAHLIACGEMVKRNLVDYFGLSDNQVTVIHNVVKTFDGKVIEDPLIKKLHDEGCFVVGNIGRLSEQKGMKYYIDAIPKVLKEYPNARFVIAGNGTEEAKLKELSKNLGINEYLTFLGYRNDIQNLMSQLDLVVLSSLWEGLPLTPIEAFSVGKTVVATAVDGTPEVVKDGENGLLVDARDSDQISQKIIWMMNNKSLRKEMELSAKKTFESVFSYRVFANSVLDYYKSI